MNLWIKKTPMTKRFTQLSLAIILLHSCINSDNVNTSENTPLNDTIKPVTEVTLTDTVEPESPSALKVNFITLDTNINKFAFNFNLWGYDEINTDKISNITRKGDSLTFYISDSSLCYVNETNDTENELNLAYYHLIEIDHKNNTAVIFVMMYEYHEYILVDLKSLNTIKTINRPYFSPNNETIFISNVDLEAGFTDNGFEIIEHKNNTFTRQYKQILDDWSINKATWIDNNNLIILYAKKDKNYNDVFEVKLLSIS